MYKCCIFDLDGTIINTIHALTRSLNLTLDTFGLGPVDEAHTKVFVGDGYKKLIERALLWCGDKELSCYEKALSVYGDTFRENCLYRIEPYEGMRELLEFLKGRGIKLAVLTNKSHERALENVEAVYGTGVFDLVTGEQEGMARKPDPAGVFLTMERLGMRPEECLYLGDTNTDMETGLAAGVDTVGVTWGFRDRGELAAFHPKYLADHPVQIKKIFQQTETSGTGE